MSAFLGVFLVVMIAIALLFRSNLAGGADTVGGYFDHPPSYPGNPWTRYGPPVSSSEILAVAGPAHCNLESVTFLTVGWPLGTRATSAVHARQFLRDPQGKVLDHPMLGSWERNPDLPVDAIDTGYRYGTIKLYFAPSDEDRYAYLVAPRDSERWPRSDPMLACD